MSKQPILIICDSLPGTLTSTGSMVDSLRLEFEVLGYDVRLAGIGSEPQVRGQELTVYSPWLKSRHVSVRALAELGASIWLGIRLLLSLLTRRNSAPGLVVLFVPSLFLCLPAWMVKRAVKAKTYLVQRDIVPDWMVVCGQVRRGLGVSALYALKNFCLKHADHIGIECKENMEFFPARFRHKISVLHNWRNFSRAVHSGPASTDRLIFVYGGRVGHVQGFDRFLRPFAELRDDRVLLRIYCDERGRSEIAEMGLSDKALAHIQILPMLPEAEFLAQASNATFGVVTLAPDMRTHNIPGKMLAYLAAGIPVFALGPPSSALGRVVKESEIGCYADARLPDQIRKKLAQAVGDLASASRTRQAVINARRSFGSTLAAQMILKSIYGDE